ncbi:MAG: undecaprenyl-diphosphate phosphatase [Candidatus Dormibacteraeota bacterium]|nr:undecaprenyl-diphosphate phosphatase [Candidatus Dormibacteraeota bacterium]MBO0743755.1 undecaprenyl-diphosphate phosphatase [Candidatus Dormibacteraeota bacterium]
MSFLQALVLALVQGVTELFPISSLGHAVLIPPLLHWSFRESDPTFLPFLVLLHLGTATALFILYWRQWVTIVRAFIRAAMRGRIETPDERLALLLVAATVPAAIVGVLLQTYLQRLFASPVPTSVFLFCNGIVLLGAELLRRRAERRAKVGGESRQEQEAHFRSLEDLPLAWAVGIGCCQALALVPGFSRSGVTMVGGLFANLKHTEAARFAFLLATPIILGAAVIEIPDLFRKGVPLATYGVAAIVTGVAAYLSARFLLRYFRSGRLDPYGWYCMAAGAAAFVFFVIR